MVWTGDLNCAHEEIDIYETKGKHKVRLVLVVWMWVWAVATGGRRQAGLCSSLSCEAWNERVGGESERG